MATDSDVERRARLDYYKRVEAHIPLRVKRAGQRKPMPHVSSCRTVLTREIVRLRRKCSEAIGVAHCAIQNVRGRQRNIFIESGIKVSDQLVLVVQTGRLHYENRAGFHFRRQQVQSMRVSKGDGDGCLKL